eukprot:172529_1
MPQDLIDVLTNQISDITAKRDELSKTLESQKTLMNQKDDALKEWEEKYERLQSLSSQKANSKFQEMKYQYEYASNMAQSLQSKVDQLQEDLDSTKRVLNDKESKSAMYQEMKYQYEHAATMAESLQNKVNQLQEALDSAKRVLNDKDTSLQQLESKVMDKDKEIESMRQEILDTVNRYNVLQSTHQALQEERNKEVIQSTLLKKEKEELEAECVRLTVLRKENEQDLEQKEPEDEDEICKTKFKHWLLDTVKLKRYLTNFEGNEADDVRMIEFLDEQTVAQDIGIRNRLHCKLVLKKAAQFRESQMEFNQMIKNDPLLKEYKDVFEQRGILRLQDLKSDVKTPKDLGNMLGIVDEERVNVLWTNIHPEDVVMVASNNEGQKTLYMEH